MSKIPGQYRYCLIMLATALAIITSSKADFPIQNYPLSAKQEESCEDSEGNLITCPQHHSQFHHNEYPQLET